MKNSTYLKVALLCLLGLGTQVGVALGWNIDLTYSPWHTDSSCDDEYCVYNTTGERVFVYHEKTGAKYTLGPGENGYLTHKGAKLQCHPNELRCGFLDGRRQCVVRLAPFGYKPGIVLEALDFRPAYPVRPRAVAPPPAMHAREMQSPQRESRPSAREVQPPPQEVRKASAPPSARSETVNLPELLRLLLERMVHVYHRERGEEKDRKLAGLKEVFDRNLAGILPKDTAAKLKDYEALCQCIHQRAASGMSLDEIFREGRCGTRSTRELRTEIVNEFTQRLNRQSHRPAM